MPFKIRSRLSVILLFFGIFLGISLLDRTILLFKAADVAHPGILGFLEIYGMGLLFDLSAAIYFLIPFIILLVLIPDRFYRGHVGTAIVSALLFALVFGLGFTAVSEYLFWDEFASRFNFIAVDYLVYTSEVIGNIRESYPVRSILIAVAIASLVVIVMLRRSVVARIGGPGGLKHRGSVLLLFLLLPVLDFIVVDASYAHVSENRYVNELASNGIYSFFAAFRNNELDYSRYYQTEPEEQVKTNLAQLLSNNVDADLPGLLQRSVHQRTAEQRYNVVLITVESLSAKFFSAFGNQQGLTPNLDHLAKEGLLFTDLQATGTRTVRGLEAISLSVPPTPGRSIVKRPHNANLYNIGTELQRRGYTTRFIYGGYGYFDNMNEFFSNNGFEIVDRTDLSEEEIHFANTWGVSDEDLLDRVLKEADQSADQGKLFFNLVMTTSNHRPFTYPEGKIDIPSHTGREGAVKYTDYAIGRFIEQAKQHTWFDNTIFIIIADHCASSAGERDLAVNKYHIPLLIYAPAIIKPGTVDTLASQIDLAPTLLGLLHFDYESHFFGRDLLATGGKPNRAFVGNYQKLGYLHNDILTILSPQQKVEQYRVDLSSGKYLESISDTHELDDTIAYYQGASLIYEENGLTKRMLSRM
jgi:phosphoglycerol transferase MdoB-like AlkP superfamily enzyme